MRQPHPALILTAALVVLANLSPLQAEEFAELDASVLREQGLGTDGASALAFLRGRTFSANTREQFQLLIKQLGHKRFALREAASRKLILWGVHAVPYLQEATQEKDPEIVRRAENALQQIECGPGSALPIAAIRVLARSKPTGAGAALLAFVPFAEDAQVEDEALNALLTLYPKADSIDPPLRQSLEARLSRQRAAAAFVLGRLNNQPTVIRRCLSDDSAVVRLRAAEALLAANDLEAIPPLIELLALDDPTLSYKAEQLLFHVAGENSPRVSAGDGSKEALAKQQMAWRDWWRENEACLTIPPLERPRPLLGFTVIAQRDANKVWECGHDGKPRWTISNVEGPVEAHVLPGNRVLIAEFSGKKVTERDLTGKVLWEKTLPQNPTSCQRLPNGNTFIATTSAAMEVTPEGKEVYSYSLRPERGDFGSRGGFGRGGFGGPRSGGSASRFGSYGAFRQPNGHLLVLRRGSIVEVDPLTRKTIRDVNLYTTSFSSVEVLPGGRFLVALNSRGLAAEYDSEGRKIWEYRFPGVHHATRLPNGNTLLSSQQEARVIEITRAGKVVWQQETDTPAWRIQRR